MGKTRRNYGGSKFDDDESRNGKRPKHSRNPKGQGMRVLNMVDEDEYDDPFYEEQEIKDEIFITHTKHTN